MKYALPKAMYASMNNELDSYRDVFNILLYVNITADTVIIQNYI